ncbi:alpha/beta hydrolase [Pseudomonas sp. NY15463]|uniref:alpha/beta hydrolase n=1 Tax=Pseudomonas sp. NY15463 TaxID=3400361 RepID=UPI003A850BD4
MPDLSTLAIARPEPLRVPRSYQATFAKARCESFEWGDLEVRCHHWEGSAPVLCVHGSNGNAAQFGTLIDGLLAAGRGVLAVDIPSHDPQGRFIPSTFIWEALLQTRRYAQPAAVVAHSMACSWVMRALNAGLGAQRLVCLSPAATQEYVFQRFLQMQQAQGLTMGDLAAAIDQAFGPEWRQAYSPIELCKTLSLPTLIHHDEADPVIEIEAGARALRGVWAGAQFIETRGLGHSGVFRNTALIERVIEFIQCDNP